MTHDSLCVSEVGYTRDNLPWLEYYFRFSGTQGLDYFWRQFDFEWQRRLKFCNEIKRFLWVIEHDCSRRPLTLDTIQLTYVAFATTLRLARRITPSSRRPGLPP